MLFFLKKGVCSPCPRNSKGGKRRTKPRGRWEREANRLSEDFRFSLESEWKPLESLKQEVAWFVWLFKSSHLCFCMKPRQQSVRGESGRAVKKLLLWAHLEAGEPGGSDQGPGREATIPDRTFSEGGAKALCSIYSLRHCWDRKGVGIQSQHPRKNSLDIFGASAKWWFY